MLEIVERPSVCNRRHECAKLQRSHGDTLAKAAHPAYTAFRLRNGLARIDTKLLALNVPPGKLAEAELRRIVVNALEAEFPTEFFEVEIVALGDGVGHVHAEASELNGGIAPDQALVQSG